MAEAEVRYRYRLRVSAERGRLFAGWRLTAGAVMVMAAPIAGCGPSATPTGSAAVPASTTSVAAVPAAPVATTPVATTPVATTAPATATPAGGGPVVADGPGWTPAGLEGPSFPSETCTPGHTVFEGQTQPLPDPHCTPGGIDPAVTQSDLDTTICRSGGYTSTVRPPESLTEPAKYRAIRAYGDYAGSSARPYEFDHLIPLELGGASSTENLWPEQDIGATGPYIHNAKDQVEDDLHAAVCAHAASLAAAQNAIAADWTSAEAILGVSFGSANH